YFTGIGRHKRIVFFDTLLEQLAHPEVEAVLAHELGHFRLRHVRQRLLLSVALAFAGLALLGWLSRAPGFYAALGVPVPSTHAAPRPGRAAGLLKPEGGPVRVPLQGM